MPRDPACRNCAEKKVGCKPSAGVSACQRCVIRKLRCEWPNAAAPPSPSPGTHKTSCERCRIKRIKCERQASDSLTCVPCSVKGEVCSLGMSASPPPTTSSPGPSNAWHSSAPPTGGPTLTTPPETDLASAHNQASAATHPPARARASWLDVVLTPSQQ